MSIFPRHIVRGQALTVHTRIGVTERCFSLLQLRIIDPTGACVHAEQQQQLAWPAPPDVMPAERQCAADGMIELTPRAWAAERRAISPEQQMELSKTLLEIQQALHGYRVWTCPDDALLGRYTVEIALWAHGTCYASRTAQADSFLVEELSVESRERDRGEWIARVRNHAPLETEGRLLEYSRHEGRVTATARPVQLAALSVSELRSSAEVCRLSYADGARVLDLQWAETGRFVRHPACAWGRQGNAVWVAHGLQGRAFTLHGPTQRVWLAADGLAGEEHLRTHGGAAFDALLAAGLLQKC